MEKPHTGLIECPRILLSCFRARNSGNERTSDYEADQFILPHYARPSSERERRENVFSSSPLPKPFLPSFLQRTNERTSSSRFPSSEIFYPISRVVSDSARLNFDSGGAPQQPQPEHLPALLSLGRMLLSLARWMKFSRRSLSSAIIFLPLEMGAGREGKEDRTKKEKKKQRSAFLMMNPLRPLI